MCRAIMIMAMLWCVRLTAAPPQVTYLYPAGGQIGQTVSVTAGGSFATWPVQVRTDRTDLSIECDAEKGKLQVKILPEAQPGVAWLRLFDAEGSAALRPFRIGGLPEVMEQEPNDESRKAQPLSESAVANGQLAKNGDVDVFSLPLVKGQTLVAAMEAHRGLGSPMDAALQILSPEGFVLAQNDDERGFDPLLAFTASAAGTYLIRTFAFPATPNSSINFAGESTYVYRLTLTTGPYVDAALPLALSRGQSSPLTFLGWNLPDDLKLAEISPAADATLHVLASPRFAGMLRLPVVEQRLFVAGEQRLPIDLPATLSGQLLAPRAQHEYSFAATKGQKLVFRSESRSLGFALDPVLTLCDGSGKQVAQNDDAARDNRESELSYTVPADGEYVLQVRDLHRQGGPRFVYRVTAGTSAADFALKLAAESFTLAAGKTVEIAVSVDRQNGFKEEIEVAAANLPEGVMSEPVKSAGSGESAKSVKLKLTAADETVASGSIRIQGRTMTEPPRTRTASATLAGLDATIEDVWLTVTKK